MAEERIYTIIVQKERVEVSREVYYHAMRAAAREAVPMTALPGPVGIDCQAPGRCAE